MSSDPTKTDRPALTDADIKAMLERAEAASPGPWRHIAADSTYVYRSPAESRHANGFHVGEPADAAFCAAARSDVPALARECLRRGAENAALRGMLAEAEGLIETLDVLLEMPRPAPIRHSVAAKELRTRIRARLGEGAS